MTDKKTLYFKWFLAMNENFQYDGTFSDNILVVGQTGCGKTSFVQSLGKKKMFGDRLISVDWVSKINLTKSREDEITECFSYTNVEFHYPDDLQDITLLIETFQKDTLDDDNQETKENNDNNNCNIFGEKKIDKVIVMDHVSGLAEKLNDFSYFLTVNRNFGYICLYIFHIIYLSKSIWQMILSQRKILNIFPSSIQLGNIVKFLTNYCDRETKL